MRSEIEIHLAKLYIHPLGEGWRFSLLDFYNFDTGAGWTFLVIDWNPCESPGRKRLMINLL